MKRFHVHLHVDNLAESIGFYSKLFAAEPSRSESDYAKWMLPDPPVNFAISTRGEHAGIDHLGIQTDNAEELVALKARAQAADMALLDDGETTCCYARSEKHWVTDPQGIAWEHFHTLGNVPVFHERTPDEQAAGSACCASAPVGVAGATAVAVPTSTPTRGRAIAIPVVAKPAPSCC
jgi:hypothetical protein